MTATNASSPGVVSRPARPENGIRSDEPSVALAERRDPREQAEVDGERLAALVPRAPAEGGHPEPRRVAVERDRERQRARARRLRVAELERREAEEEERGRPDAEPLRVARAAASSSCPSRSARPRDAVRDREPRVERRPDVPEQHLHRARGRARRSRRRTSARGSAADDGSPTSAVRKTSTSRPAETAPSSTRRTGRAQDPLEPGRQRPAGRAALELRALPERAEQRGTRGRARRPRPRRRASREPAGRERRRCRARAASGTDLELGDLEAAVLELDLEAPGRVGGEPDRRGRARVRRRPSGRSRAGARRRELGRDDEHDLAALLDREAADRSTAVAPRP